MKFLYHFMIHPHKFLSSSTNWWWSGKTWKFLYNRKNRLDFFFGVINNLLSLTHDSDEFVTVMEYSFAKRCHLNVLTKVTLNIVCTMTTLERRLNEKKSVRIGKITFDFFLTWKFDHSLATTTWEKNNYVT